MEPIDKQIRYNVAAKREAELPAECCSRCRFSSKNSGDITGRTLVCRRYPPSCAPVMQGNQVGTMVMLPTMKPEQWCGEFAAPVDSDPAGNV